MNKLKSLSTNPTLRNYAQDASQKAVRKIADFLAPTVEVPSLHGQYKRYTAKHRFKIADTRYQPGERATRIGFTAKDEYYNLQPHALDFPIPELEKMESEELMNQAQYGADLLSEQAGLSHENEVVQMALETAGAGTAFNVNQTNPVDALDEVIMDVKKLALNGASVALLFGTTAFRLWKNAPKVKDMFNGVQKLLRSPNLEDTSGMLMFNPECQMSEMVIDTAPEGKDAEIEWILDNALFVFARSPNPTTMDSSFMKTFRLRNQWMKPGTYDTEDKRAEVLKFDWTCKPLITNAPGIVRLNLAAS